ncbi:hypothetical protein Ga0466249_003945 [Sporomusaceae bacterium BoRhaA]|uniref:macro domain-containing protein n=1 Tax=Pelorhabdus rhamnosifermentans TaxID=2772457 RepID=UPI001C061F69|nr:macro domain-containing protein [Pelorhabdus rhamnosifermentans]MBU2702810.1 hypothetical protein [Pelorhabdus rhamnosifermentans]
MYLKRFLAALYINLKTIILLTLKICGILFTANTTLLTFISWDDIGKLSVCHRLFYFASIIIASLIISFLIVIFKRTKTIWENGTGRISIIYGDIFKISFPKKNKENRIVVIPVNTHFDTIIDEYVGNVAKPLVSIKTVHGQWLKKMFSNITQEQLDTTILDSLNLQNKQFNFDDTRYRGNKREYPTGTTAIVPGENNVTFFLLALSKFDENNNAQCDDDSFIEALRKLIRFYNASGQGYTMYLPLMGTNLSRAGFSHVDALNKITSILKLESNQIHGQINVVVYSKDKDKVSIWQ